jgi:hypothetical protein
MRYYIIVTDEIFQPTSLPSDRVRMLLEQFDALDPNGRKELHHSLSTVPSDQLARLRTDPGEPVAVDPVNGPCAHDNGLWIPGAAFGTMMLIVATFLFMVWKTSA